MQGGAGLRWFDEVLDMNHSVAVWILVKVFNRALASRHHPSAVEFKLHKIGIGVLRQKS